MIAVDTNVLVRLFGCDDEAQAVRAQGLLDAQAEEDGSLFISDAVLAEFAWTLARDHSFSIGPIHRYARGPSTACQ